MTEMKLTHWKKLTNPNYIGAHDFQPNQEIKVKIKELKTESVKNQDGKAETCMVLYFEGAGKPMILNKTNAKTIEKVVGTAFIEQWPGKEIILFVSKVKAFGDVVDAVRVKMQRP